MKAYKKVKLISSLLLTLLIPGLLFAQTGKVYDNLSVQSKILNMDRKFALYLPPDYDTSERSYPVLYLLHGGGDDQTGWVQFGEVLRITDNAIRDGIATPMIIVMPDADTGKRGYSNRIGGDWQYEDFFFQELVPYVESHWRIKGEKRYRAIAGLSMGGTGTLIYTLHHPEMFSSACPLSTNGGQRTFEAYKNRPYRFSNEPQKTYSEDVLRAYFEKNSAIFMMEHMPVDSLKSVRWYMDSGDDDRATVGFTQIHNVMMEREIPHEFRIRDGAHNWTYWRASLPQVLKFVSDAFHQY